MIKRKSLISAPAVLNTSDAAMWITGWNEAVDALEAEQEKAVEPHGWMIDGSSEVMSRGHAQAVQTEHQAMGGTAVAYPIYTHPAPPASDHVPEAAFGNTERAELIAKLRTYSDELDAMEDAGIQAQIDFAKAADMLEADGKAQQVTHYDQQALELCDKCGWKAIMPGEPCFVCNMKTEAQQVAVPAGWALVPIEPTPEMIAAGRDAPVSSALEDIDADYCAVYKAMLAAAQGAKLVTKKDSKTDWSAA